MGSKCCALEGREQAARGPGAPGSAPGSPLQAWRLAAGPQPRAGPAPALGLA